MYGESGVNRSIIDEVHSSDIQGDQMKGGSGVTRSIIDELHSLDLQGDQTVDESGVTRSMNMNFTLRIFKEIKGKVKVVLLELSLMKFILEIS